MVAVVVKVLLFVWCSCGWVSVCSAANDAFLAGCHPEQKMEVVFVQDASFSVSNESFEAAKIFISDITRELSIGPDLVRVALVRFGNYADVIARLSQSRDVSAVTQAIAGMKYQTGGTQTGLALETVQEQVLNERRSDARAVVVVITDGQSNNFYQTRKEARKLRRASVRLVWLYIDANDTDSRAFGRERTFMTDQNDTTLGAASFQALDEESRKKILRASCKEDPVPETTTTTTTTMSTTTTSTVTPDLQHHNATSPTNPTPVITDSDASVTEAATSPTDDDERTTSSTVEPSAVEDVTTASPKSSANASAHMQPSESETVTRIAEETKPATLPKSTSDFGPSQPTIDPLTSASGTERKLVTETEPGSTSSLDVTTIEERSPSTTGIEQGKEEEKSEAGASRGEGTGSKDEDDEEEERKWEDDWRIIVGATVGGIVTLAALSACLYYALKRRKNNGKTESAHNA
ncbi:hypothetical protein ACOMHN_055251 [Nucella lapillus]